MTRVLTCIDAVPAQDGTCAQTAWLDQASWVDMLPTVQQAGVVGGAYFVGLMTLAVVRGLLNPKTIEE
ncbi:hypothetical protein [Xanthomonas translucens]|uniref:Uncharacterized protein n=2 Tax=Xanthomonas campestris pv. translucens TaxID=343 RepID=A0A109HHG4_XANCT|nr:hypothetical protein [Xanthomonas translucens]KWV12210.1 hypothetical protein ATB53_18110 [Xanthomonas translucens]UII62134.1 hypothetical protein LZE81_09415 [Xanthomonas translucens]